MKNQQNNNTKGIDREEKGIYFKVQKWEWRGVTFKCNKLSKILKGKNIIIKEELSGG